MKYFLNIIFRHDFATNPPNLFFIPQPTSPNRGWFVPPFGGNPWWVYLAAAIPALLVTILLFMDQQITAVIVNRKEHKLKVAHAERGISTLALSTPGSQERPPAQLGLHSVPVLLYLSPMNIVVLLFGFIFFKWIKTLKIKLSLNNAGESELIKSRSNLAIYLMLFNIKQRHELYIVHYFYLWHNKRSVF